MTQLAFILWIPITVALFSKFRPAKAVTMAYLCGWLLLPATEIKMQGFWDIDKTLVIAAGVVVGILLCCRNPLAGLQPCWSDVFLVGFALAAAASSLTNGLGTYDGASTFVNKLIYYGVAFGCGRLFLRERRDLHEAVQSVCCAAALYALLSLWEWRMSPQIHQALYGEFQHKFQQHKRWSFFRPVVCFPHALSLGVFMAGASLMSVWLYMNRALRSVGPLSPGVIVSLCLVGLVTSMSVGPWGLFAAGFVLLWSWKQTRLRMLAVIPLVFVVSWVGMRYTGASDGEWLVAIAKQASAERADSLQYRIDAETLLLDHAKSRPWFGWGGWGRNQVFRESGKNAFANDGLWLIIVGQYGLMGLIAFYLWWCWPMVLSLAVDHRLEDDPVVTALIVVIGLEAINGMFNGVMSPLTIFLAGGTASVLTAMRSAPNRSHAPMMSMVH